MFKFWFGIGLLAMAAVLVFFGQYYATEGWKEWKGTATNPLSAKLPPGNDFFRATFHVLVNIKFPGPLLFLYDSKFGKTISPISVALFVEVTNSKDKIARIQDYKIRARTEYDEGGQTIVSKAPSGGTNFSYQPSGKVVEKWRNLYSVGFLHNQVYYMTNNLSKCRRMDFSMNGFDRIARQKQLLPGESIMGWIFTEVDPDLRGQVAKIIELEIALTNSFGEKQTIRAPASAEANDISSMISAGTWIVLPGEYDLTKEKYTLSPMVDARQIIKDGKASK